jgi:hypothetical protein
MKKRLLIPVLICLISAPFTLMGQTGGDNTYEFLNLPWSARGSALGGTIVSIRGEEPSLIFSNPALSDPGMAGMLSLGYTNYLAGISFGSASYVFNSTHRGTLSAGVNWLNYGDFLRADNAGTISGEFRAAEYAMNLSFSRTFDTIFSIGVTCNPVISQLESYTSLGFAVDIGAAVESRDRLTSAGIVLKNIGAQITSYAGEEREALPFEIEAGVSRKLAHAPFRFTLTLRNLQKFDLTHRYDTTSYQGINGSETTDESFTENLFRHTLFGVELLPHKNFWIGAGYNYQRRSELKIDTGGAAAGFSWGFGVNISGFRIIFSRATYHLAGGSSQFSVAFNPGTVYRRITDSSN